MTSPLPPNMHQHDGQWWHDHPDGSVPHSHAPQQFAAPPVPNVGRDATRAVVSGFAGCLGVGIAVVAVVFLLALLAHGGH